MRKSEVGSRKSAGEPAQPREYPLAQIEGPGRDRPRGTFV